MSGACKRVTWLVEVGVAGGMNGGTVAGPTQQHGWMELATVYWAPEIAQETPNRIKAWRPKLAR